MKHFFLVALLLLPSFAFAEQINSFTSDIFLSQDGTFVVTETIEYDFGSEERHGIYRYIDKKHPQEASSFLKERTIDIVVQDVTLEGDAVPFEITDSSGTLDVKIGDPYTTITGKHRYVISYKVTGGYSYFDDETTEVYWNVTGNGWEVPIQSVIATVHADGTFLNTEKACYKGLVGVSLPCDDMRILDEGTVQFTAEYLTAYEGLTIAQSLDASQIDTVVQERFNILLIAVLLLPLVVLFLIIFAYRYRTYFKTGNPIIAQYEPYENCKPMYAGLLLDGNLDPRDITAGIVYLAEQGFIKIKKSDKKVLFFFEVDDYEITLIRTFAEIENEYLRDVLSLIFGDSAEIGSVVALSSLKNDLSKQKSNALKLQKLRKDLKKDMQEHGFYQVHGSLLTSMFVVGGLIFVLLIFIEVISWFASPESLFLLFGALGFVLILFLILYERRTRKGYEAQDHLKGFKLFLSVTDQERFTFHNAPQKSPEQFMEYLPYAIAFGVEKQWAKVFEGITIPSPSWYDGGGAGSFSAVNLTSSLGAFSTSFAASSGSSGSSGGGSSGGGGGGGGGGSW